MPYPWIEEFCLAMKGATRVYKPEWEALLYQVGGKMFAMQGGDNKGRRIITVKLEPSFGEMLRSRYEDIRPGYYMNKQHWNSVDLGGCVPDELLKTMFEQSYRLVLHSLPKKRQKEILEA